MKKCRKFNPYEFIRVYRGLIKRSEIATRRLELLAWEVVYAERKLAPLQADYREISERLYVMPIKDAFYNVTRWQGSEKVWRETQFISFIGANPVTHEREPLYEYTEGGWREIDEVDRREIDDLECQLLDAFEDYNEAARNASDITPEQWQEFRKQGLRA